MHAGIKKGIRITSVYLVNQLAEFKNCSRNEAIELLLRTSVYEALMDLETEIYLESKEAVWDMLKEELSGNPQMMLVV